jgi:hypothetical protein
MTWSTSTTTPSITKPITKLVQTHVPGFTVLCFLVVQIDKELATGEFFLRESVKKRKKMEEIKVTMDITWLLSLGCYHVALDSYAPVTVCIALHEKLMTFKTHTTGFTVPNPFVLCLIVSVFPR